MPYRYAMTPEAMEDLRKIRSNSAREVMFGALDRDLRTKANAGDPCIQDVPGRDGYLLLACSPTGSRHQAIAAGRQEEDEEDGDYYILYQVLTDEERSDAPMLRHAQFLVRRIYTELEILSVLPKWPGN
jgi:hypothetical protein